MTIDLSSLDEGILQDWIVAQRWFGSKSREVSHVEIAECVPLREEPPELALALDRGAFRRRDTRDLPAAARAAPRGGRLGASG